MKEFKIRCSAIGQIVSGNMGLTDIQEAKLFDLENKTKALTLNQAAELEKLRNKKLFPELPATAKSYCQAWIKEQLYDRRKDIVSKYLEKGNEVENESIAFIGRQLGVSEFELETGQFAKNEQFFEDAFIQGTPDVITKDYIIDTKSSWDAFTFPLFEEELPNSDYYWQAQGYMKLVGIPDYKLAYTLMNTPDSLIEAEARRYCYKNGIDMEDVDYQEFYDHMTYDHIPPELKIKIFDIKFNELDILLIVERVVACREYIAKELAKLPESVKQLHGIEG